MSNNKKGFTLVEILMVVVLLSLLFGLAAPAVGKLSKKIKQRSLNHKVEIIEKAGIAWGQDNKALLRNESNCKVGEPINYDCYKISIEDLFNEDYLDDDANDKKIINPVTEKDFVALKDKCQVYVYKKNNRVYAQFGNDTCYDAFK